jgi:monolysocardiolipin acyltransferase
MYMQNQVHFFSEGKINQPNTYPQHDGIAHLPRFKWGMSVLQRRSRGRPF